VILELITIVMGIDFCLLDLLRLLWGLSLSHRASVHCLPDLIAWSGFGVAPVDGIAMNVLVIDRD
jgi:hypothetical protein